MKGLKKGMMVLIAALSILGAGCIIHDEDDDDCYDCGPVDNSGWYMLGPDTTLEVGEECPVTCLPDLCLGYADDDAFYDTIYLTDADYGLDEVHLNYAVENYGYDYTDITVTLCDTYGCEDVAYLPDLAPGEYWEESIDSEVLDSVMIDFYDCLDYYGGYCEMYYDIDVYVYEDGTCSDVGFSYFFEGYYLW